MKEITIRKEKSYEKLKCLKFDCSFYSFKDIWNVVHESMAHLAEKCKNCKFQIYDCLSFDDGCYEYTFNQIVNIWKQNNAEFAWIKIFECNSRIYDGDKFECNSRIYDGDKFECNSRIYDGDKAEDLRNAFLPFMYEKNSRIYFDAISYLDYIIIYEYKNGQQLFGANERFIDMFAEG